MRLVEKVNQINPDYDNLIFALTGSSLFANRYSIKYFKLG